MSAAISAASSLTLASALAARRAIGLLGCGDLLGELGVKLAALLVNLGMELVARLLGDGMRLAARLGQRLLIVGDRLVRLRLELLRRGEIACRSGSGAPR